jgi:DNA-binding cell septation regulator SpoVG
MNISDIKFFPMKDQTKATKAFASCVVDGWLKLTGIKVIEAGKGPFIGMPATKGKDRSGADKYFDIFHSITKEGKEEFQSLILEAWANKLADDALGGDGGDDGIPL